MEGLQSDLNSEPGAQQDIIEAVEGSPSQCGVIKMFWDTGRLSVTEPGEAGGHLGELISAGGQIISRNILTNRLSVTEDQGWQPAQEPA